MISLLSSADTEFPKIINLQKPAAERELSYYNGSPSLTLDQSKQTFLVVGRLIPAHGYSKMRNSSNGCVEKDILAFGVLEFVSTRKHI